MIRAAATGPDGTRLLLFGLSEENVKRLKQGKPIRIAAYDLEAMGLPKTEIMIMYGRTEDDMRRELAPVIGPDTRINDI